MKHFTFALLFLVLAAPSVARPDSSPVEEDFEHGVSSQWTTEGLGPQKDQGMVEAMAEPGGNHFLRISTDGSFYSLGIDSPFDPEKYPVLSWRWRVERMPERADIASRSGDDAGARLFVVFRAPKDSPRASDRKLEYVWDTTHPAGTILPDPYAPEDQKAIVLESGSAKRGQWVREQVNLLDDYKRAFGEKPGWVKTIAFASDSNETRSKTISDFDDLQINPSAAPK